MCFETERTDSAAETVNDVTNLSENLHFLTYRRATAKIPFRGDCICIYWRRDFPSYSNKTVCCSILQFLNIYISLYFVKLLIMISISYLF